MFGLLGGIQAQLQFKQALDMPPQFCDEILSLSDRIGVVHEGAVLARFDGTSATRAEVGLLMADGSR